MHHPRHLGTIILLVLNPFTFMNAPYTDNGVAHDFEQCIFLNSKLLFDPWQMNYVCHEACELCAHVMVGEEIKSKNLFSALLLNIYSRDHFMRARVTKEHYICVRVKRTIPILSNIYWLYAHCARGLVQRKPHACYSSRSVWNSCGARPGKWVTIYYINRAAARRHLHETHVGLNKYIRIVKGWMRAIYPLWFVFFVRWILWMNSARDHEWEGLLRRFVSKEVAFIP